MKVILFLLAIVSTTTLFANEWKHIKLKSTEGVEINIDYQTYNRSAGHCTDCRGYVYAKNVWVNISGEKVKENSQVRVVFINKYRSSYYDYQNSNPVVIQDLKRAGNGTHTGQLGYFQYNSRNSVEKLYKDFAIYAYGNEGTWIYKQAISVVVDGNWQVDPASSQTNFEFNMDGKNGY